MAEKTRKFAYKFIEALAKDDPQFLKHWDISETGLNEYRVRLSYRYRLRYYIAEKNLIKVFYIGFREGLINN